VTLLPLRLYPGTGGHGIRDTAASAPIPGYRRRRYQQHCCPCAYTWVQEDTVLGTLLPLRLYPVQEDTVLGTLLPLRLYPGTGGDGISNTAAPAPIPGTGGHGIRDNAAPVPIPGYRRTRYQ